MVNEIQRRFTGEQARTMYTWCITKQASRRLVRSLLTLPIRLQ